MALGHWLKDYIGPKGSANSASIPTPTVEDAGKSIVVNDEGQYELSAQSDGDFFIIKQTYNEDTGDTIYISNKVFVLEEDDSRSYIFEDEDRKKYPLVPVSSGFAVTFINPQSDPSVGCMVFTPDNDDDTGRIYKMISYTASLTFTEGD